MTTHDAGDESIDWSLITRRLSGDTATSVALEAIDGALVRLQGLDESQIRQAFSAIAEGTWWVAALDEQLVKGLRQLPASMQAYKAARDADEHGRYIRGFLWVRNRHTHQLPFTAEHDDTSAFGHKDAVIKLSKGLIWRPSEDLPPADRRFKENQDHRGAYDDLLAGQSLWQTLWRCSEWFHAAAGHDRGVGSWVSDR
ncbi:hypothetical protein [Frondihabitans sp. VKM Ac-2883]|uniref:hypothetical protein n=1 Tax=Frondihabitans sp. VKM Ac-2883 TaxID=2783823 RepID=UPI00188A0B40|nr:hypothetical protein [Frondihabitans sp. VKM Ac-2883]MBF4575193.1 hypothetical protein [Frondihabitans sp. VKM Ac-2883]